MVKEVTKKFFVSVFLCFICTFTASSIISLNGNAAETKYFHSAKPVWIKGLENEMNILAGFRAVVNPPDAMDATLRIAGATVYRIYLNGEFTGYGPARGPHGFYRMDEIPLPLQKGNNIIAIEAAGYNVNSYSLLDQPSFIEAEVICNGAVVASTGGEGSRFQGVVLTHRLQKVQRYSFQRPFSEYYKMQPSYAEWWKKSDDDFHAAEIEETAPKNILPRRVAFTPYLLKQPVSIVSRGTLRQDAPVQNVWKDRSLTAISPALKGFKENELAATPSVDMQKVQNISSEKINTNYNSADAIALGNNQYTIVDFGKNLTGFIGTEVVCTSPVKLFITFDEVLIKDDVDFKRLGCVNIVSYELQPGPYKLVSMEPYTLRFAKFHVLQGDCQIKNLFLREYENGETESAQFSCGDNQINRVFEAARETFKQNAVDIFMDCPSRERAGWLCDSFFTSRVAYDLCGNTTIEKNFLENFLLPPKFAYLPDGMLPMCYPADHNDGIFIPNWAMWFVVELDEYLERSGDRQLVDALRPRVEALNAYFKKFKNQDGLLEKLEKWVFVEWSKANELVQDVNYPSNMLYAAMLSSMNHLYNMPELQKEADAIRETIRKQAYDGEFFIDNAVRKDGKLQVTQNHTEVCQYFAFYFGIATPETHKELWDKLQKQFGPNRKETKAFPEVYPANAFVGNYLRFELLSRYSNRDQIRKELIGYYLYMADQTGTLWENISAEASCDHGFASHVAHFLYRDILGISKIDIPGKKVSITFKDIALDWCQGSEPVPSGLVQLHWWKENGKVYYQANVPAGYTLDVKNEIGEKLVRK